MVNPNIPIKHSFANFDALESCLLQAKATNIKGYYGSQKNKLLLISTSRDRPCLLSIDKVCEELFRLIRAEPDKSSKAQNLLNRLVDLREQCKSQDSGPLKTPKENDAQTDALIAKVQSLITKLHPKPKEIASTKPPIIEEVPKSTTRSLPAPLLSIIGSYFAEPSNLTPDKLEEFEQLVQTLAPGEKEIDDCWRTLAKSFEIDGKALAACTTTEHVINLVKEEIAQPLITICSLVDYNSKSILPGAKEFLFVLNLGEKPRSRFEQAMLIDRWIRANPDLQNVTNLNLNNQKIRRLPPAVCELRNLTNLSLLGCDLLSLPPEIGQLTKLSNLDLRSNFRLSGLPIEFANLQKLDTLYLDGCIGFGEIPLPVMFLKNLRTLSAKHMRLTTISPLIGFMSGLIELNIESNAIETLPSTVGYLFNLGRLYAKKNKLKEFPPELCGIPLLRDIDVRQNALKTLPPEIRSLELVNFKLSYNQLETLPAEIGDMSVMTLYLDNNPTLKFLPPEISNIKGYSATIIVGPEVGNAPQMPRGKYIGVKQNEPLPTHNFG